VNVGGQADHQMFHTQMFLLPPPRFLCCCVRACPRRQATRQRAQKCRTSRGGEEHRQPCDESFAVRPMVVCGPRETGSLVTRAAGIETGFDWRCKQGFNCTEPALKVRRRFARTRRTFVGGERSRSRPLDEDRPLGDDRPRLGVCIGLPGKALSQKVCLDAGCRMRLFNQRGCRGDVNVIWRGLEAVQSRNLVSMAMSVGVATRGRREGQRRSEKAARQPLTGPFVTHREGRNSVWLRAFGMSYRGVCANR
jgi:hypothetical protein